MAARTGSPSAVAEAEAEPPAGCNGGSGRPCTSAAAGDTGGGARPCCPGRTLPSGSLATICKSVGRSTVHENSSSQRSDHIGTKITDRPVNAEKKKNTMRFDLETWVRADWRGRPCADMGVRVVVAHRSSVCACSGEGDVSRWQRDEERGGGARDTDQELSFFGRGCSETKREPWLFLASGQSVCVRPELLGGCAVRRQNEVVPGVRSSPDREWGEVVWVRSASPIRSASSAARPNSPVPCSHLNLSHSHLFFFLPRTRPEEASRRTRREGGLREREVHAHTCIASRGPSSMALFENERCMHICIALCQKKTHTSCSRMKTDGRFLSLLFCLHGPPGRTRYSILSDHEAYRSTARPMICDQSFVPIYVASPHQNGVCT
jgi:hypothetical protein